VKTKGLMVVAALQVLALAYMAGEREWVLRAGRTVFLRTAPIDPRDAMRGDYVRLGYDLSRVPRAQALGGLADTNQSFESLPLDTKVYALLRTNQDGVGELAGLSTERPAGGLFLRGRTERSWGGTLQVRYGLEAYFMEQGKAADLERGRDREGIRVPLEMETAVSPRGLAVLKGHRWCALGIGLDLDMRPDPAPNLPGRRRTVGATVRLLNASSNDLALVDLPGGRSLALVPDSQWQPNPWRWARENEPPPASTPGDVIVLKPGQIHAIKIAFDQPLWTIAKGELDSSGNPRLVSLSGLTNDWSARFRFEYRPPDPAASASLPNAALIWHGRLPSRAFNPAGNLD
jgi:uncharacterized membrane-anchored protein